MEVVGVQFAAKCHTHSSSSHQLATGPVAAQEVAIALSSEPTTLDPQIREDGGERAVNDNIYETLMVRTPDGKLVPGHFE